MSKIKHVEPAPCYIDSSGCEKLDPTPASLPVGFHRPPTLQEQIRRLVRSELSDAASKHGAESFEEADDFNVGDDLDPSSPYEEQFEHNANIESLKQQVEQGKKARAALKAQKQTPSPDAPALKTDSLETKK